MATPSSSDAPQVCCTPRQAWAWLKEVSAMALGGDDDAKRALPVAVGHFLEAVRYGRAVPLEGMT
jgi:hypothetical protein